MTPDVIGTAEREMWTWSTDDIQNVVEQLWRAYASGEAVTLTPQQMRATLVTLADGADRMEREFWEDVAHEA